LQVERMAELRKARDVMLEQAARCVSTMQRTFRRDRILLLLLELLTLVIHPYLFIRTDV
jgi:hypothetical protein